jgi:hypothetical protein
VSLVKAPLRTAASLRNVVLTLALVAMAALVSIGIGATAGLLYEYVGHHFAAHPAEKSLTQAVAPAEPTGGELHSTPEFLPESAEAPPSKAEPKAEGSGEDSRDAKAGGESTTSVNAAQPTPLSNAGAAPYASADVASAAAAQYGYATSAVSPRGEHAKDRRQKVLPSGVRELRRIPQRINGVLGR